MTREIYRGRADMAALTTQIEVTVTAGFRVLLETDLDCFEALVGYEHAFAGFAAARRGREKTSHRQGLCARIVAATCSWCAPGKRRVHAAAGEL